MDDAGVHAKRSGFHERQPPFCGVGLKTARFDERSVPYLRPTVSNQTRICDVVCDFGLVTLESAEHKEILKVYFITYLVYCLWLFDFGPSGGALRAYPLQQLRKLISCLESKTLPLENVAVRHLIEQSLYQIGEIEVQGNDVELKWKRDVEYASAWTFLHDVLENLAEE